jgi:hypothetical protein
MNFLFSVFSADDWDLANPIATCSLHVLRRDSSLLIKLLTDKPKKNGPPGATEKHLFAQSTIALDFFKQQQQQQQQNQQQNQISMMGHWIDPVTDSSRYFAIRISDEKRKKEAQIGIGFRERNDALNFKMSLQDYENTMRKEAMVHTTTTTATTTTTNEGEGEDQHEEFKVQDDANNDTAVAPAGGLDTTVSKLSLKEGEKIHINLKGSTRTKKQQQSSSSSSNKPPLLLRKPPTSTSLSSSSSSSSTAAANNSSITGTTTSQVVVDTQGFKMSNSRDEGGEGVTSPQGRFDVSSVAAVVENMTEYDDDDDDDEWGDFESPSFDAASDDEEENDDAAPTV